ncbi:Brain-specific angiogenesis inhibitor 1-associated protein 2 [Labeo rohita]|uniref:Brain-specific angiogenesis inhibitor 1-associated protein 2 n=1 Tax=Labeo rohita TaxID=84645 RepID=A0ABQ8MT60_LABRO|nr:Brain-specific angiogenesis inhibitor 1-associated protein 2 [Labeo rohita]
MAALIGGSPEGEVDGAQGAMTDARSRTETICPPCICALSETPDIQALPLQRTTIMEQFNPCLRNFIAMGKNYEKALSSVTFAAKGYFDALVRMGELASESQGSKDLGESRCSVFASREQANCVA